MDYEVFLLSRIREHWLASGDARGSVVQGLSDTGRVISAAAAIMVAVFLGFATESDTVVKQIGLGMAVAVFLDATVVRMVLVPSTMALLGRWNWWLPGWLDRLLPRIDAELPAGPSTGLPGRSPPASAPDDPARPAVRRAPPRRRLTHPPSRGRHGNWSLQRPHPMTSAVVLRSRSGPAPHGTTG